MQYITLKKYPESGDYEAFTSHTVKQMHDDVLAQGFDGMEYLCTVVIDDLGQLRIENFEQQAREYFAEPDDNEKSDYEEHNTYWGLK